LANDCKIKPITFKNCVLANVGTRLHAKYPRRLRDPLTSIHLDCMANRCWGGLLTTLFGSLKNCNAFVSWARHALRDVPLATRCNVIALANYLVLEGLRRKMIKNVEERTDWPEHQMWTHPVQQFNFIHAQTASFNTGQRQLQQRSWP